MIEAIQKALLGLQTRGSFAVRRSLPAEDLVLGIKKLGPVSFPVTATVAREIIGEAVRSPFGWRDQTITDLGVRDGWQIAKSRIKIDGRRWNPVLRATLEDLRELLGLPSSGRLTARLDKLTIYGPGQFFRAHQDTEKSDRMIGTLVVVLPSRYTGGTVRVERHGQRFEARRSTRKAPTLDVIAFYSDCRHEVRPIKTGYRVALVYQLDFEAGPPRSPTAVLDPALVAQLDPVTQAVEDYFTTPQPVRFSRTDERRRPEKLVYLLDHEYTRRNLDWARLKQADSLRALALREAANRFDMEAFLCLADVHEVWQCEPEYHSYWERSNRRSRWPSDEEDDGDEEDDDIVASHHNPIDLIDSDIDLRHWRDASGKVVRFDGLAVDDSEVCFTTPSDDLEPFESSYEGYMGNYGDTLDRWYHRAAVVLWPRSHDFVVLVKTDPESAMRDVLEGLGRAGTAAETVLEKLRILLELLPNHAHYLREKSLSAVALRLALALDDPSSATELLTPLAPTAVSTRAIGPLLSLAGRYGITWCQGLLSTWHAPSSHLHPRSPWGTYSPQWLARLVDDGAQLGSTVARSIVEQQWEELRKQLERATAFRSRSPFEREREPGLTKSVRTVLRACTIVSATKPYRAALRHLTSNDSALSPVELASVAVHLAKELDVDAWDTWTIKELLDYGKKALESTSAGLHRKDGDWSIMVSRDCSCRDCDELHEFLRSSRTTHPWPLAKQRRLHIHRKIDGMGLPVTHVTRRQGRPFTLVLTKTKDLFRLEDELRHEHEQSLEVVDGLLGRVRAHGKAKTRKRRARHR